MLLGKAVSEDRVKIDLKARDKESAVRELVSLVCETEPDCEEIVSAVMERERKGSTAASAAIAFPHARLRSIQQTIVCIGISHQGIDFDSPTGELSRLIVLILSPESDFFSHIRILAELSERLSSLSVEKFVSEMRSPDAVSCFFRGV